MGLGGEIRPVPNGEDRLKEAANMGLNRLLYQNQMCPKNQLKV